ASALAAGFANSQYIAGGVFLAAEQALKSGMLAQGIPYRHHAQVHGPKIPVAASALEVVNGLAVLAAGQVGQSHGDARDVVILGAEIQLLDGVPSARR